MAKKLSNRAKARARDSKNVAQGQAKEYKAALRKGGVGTAGGAENK